MEGIKKNRSESGQREGKQLPFLLRRILRWIAFIAAAGILTLLLIFIIISIYPPLGTEGADILRSIIGDKAVAGVEMVFFQVQDVLERWKYQLGMVDPVAEWASIPLATIGPTTSPGGNLPPELPSTPNPFGPGVVRPTSTTSLPWSHANIPPMSNAKGEGVWTPYIQDAQSHIVAYKTFVQPDPNRPYTHVLIISIDLTHSRLHYVLGVNEPALPGTPERPGKIPEADRADNVLLAAFNGGFQARHGQFGAMADGIQALPPRSGLGTVIIYQDGEVFLGEWGLGFHPSKEMEAFRQNGPLVIKKGEINPQIYNNSPRDWGYTVNGVSPTTRSGIGLNKDSDTLYYFCGPSLTIEALAKSMQTAGIYNAIQLDINNYWVLFVKITFPESTPVPEQLLPEQMEFEIDRYLHQSPRDFFYLTSITTQG